MNDYINKLTANLEEKMLEYAMHEGKNINDLYMVHHYYVTEISKLFYKPQEHYSKILVIAYRKTIKELHK